MLFIAAFTFVLNVSLAKKSNERFKHNEMKKKADVTYVDKEIETVNNRIDTEIGHIKKILEDISRKIEFIYQKHYKP